MSVIHKYIWRCSNCSNHFSNIHRIEGVLSQEKKCAKCKSLNILTLTQREIVIHCKLYNKERQCYSEHLEKTYVVC